MSVLVDAFEPEELPYLLRQMGLDVTVGNYNQTPGTDIAFPDVQVIGPTYVGVSRKQATEIMGDIDAVVDQLRRELRTTDNLCLCYEGNLCWHEEGTYAGNSEYLRVKHHVGRKGNEYDELSSIGLVFHQPFTRWTAFVWRCQDLGIPVIPTGNIRGTAAFIHWLHEGHGNDMFKKLIRTRQEVRAEDPRERVWKLSLMSAPKVGPEVATALAPIFPNWTQLIAFLTEGGHIKDIPLPPKEGVRTRNIGPAIEKELRTWLGVTV